MTKRINTLKKLTRDIPNEFVLAAGQFLESDSAEIKPEYALFVKDGILTKSAPMTDLPAESDIPVYDASDFIVMPGMINSHTHAPMGFFRGFGTDAPSGDESESMIETFLFPAEKNLTPDMLEPLSYSYIAQGLKSGVTTFFDHYYFVEGVGKALIKLGARGYIAETIADIGGAFPTTETWERAKKLIENWPLDEKWVKPLIGPHALDTVSKGLLEDIAQFAKRTQIPLHFHCSQTAGERLRVQKMHGKSPVQFAADLGLLTDRTLAVHLVSADISDLKLLAASGATAVYCPTSQILYERSADIKAWIENRIHFSTATDCAASNDSCDVLQEIKTAALVIKHSGTEKLLNSSKLLRTILSNPAKAVGDEHKIGQLRAGAYADLVLIKDDISLNPKDKLKNNLVFSNSSQFVEHVMVNGHWSVFNRQLTKVDEMSLKATFLDACERIKTLIR